MDAGAAPRGPIGQVVRRDGRLRSYVVVRRSRRDRSGWRLVVWEGSLPPRARFV